MKKIIAAALLLSTIALTGAEDILAKVKWVGAKSVGENAFEVKALPRKQYGVTVRKFFRFAPGKYLVKGSVNEEVRAVFIAFHGQTKDNKPIKARGAWLEGKQLVPDAKTKSKSFAAVLTFPKVDQKFSFINFQTFSHKNVPAVIKTFQVIPQKD